jgi:hypothetical protein
LDESNALTFSVYPTPSNDKITVETYYYPEATSFAIISTTGQELILGKIIDSKTEVDISNLPNGLYFLRLTNKGTTSLWKVIRQ